MRVASFIASIPSTCRELQSVELILIFDIFVIIYSEIKDIWRLMKASNILPGDNRNTIRLTWRRPVYILKPIRRPAQSINVSYEGILITTLYYDHFQLGEEISISIPHAITKITTTVNGTITRITNHEGWMQLAVDLTTGER